ncbi:MAG: biotin/lipoyl-containing protein [Romboutsia sp.]|uniref:biotin/lipoyl-containing protein n=1 Tax=Romboutsia sp. TaxID=1965302 RepID=UPI003F3FABA6
MNAKKYHITLNGKVYEVEIEEVVEGAVTNQLAKSLPKVPSKPKSNVSNGERITAPMPGTIVNVLVKQGQVVKKGQVVAILEAMKMENEIVATVDGCIESINVDKGQNVSLGDNLLEIA